MKITFFAGLRHRLFNMLPYLAVSLLIWTVCVLSSFGGERETFFSVFTEAVGGVEHSGQFDLFGFFRYFGTFFAGLFLGMAGSVLDSETMPYFVLPRSKSFFKWWIKTVSSALLWCVLYCLIGIAVCAAAAEKSERFPPLSLCAWRHIRSRSVRQCVCYAFCAFFSGRSLRRRLSSRLSAQRGSYAES